MKHSVKQYLENNFEIIELKNKNISAKIAVNIGNTLFSLKDKNEILYFPFTLEDYKTNTKLAGNPSRLSCLFSNRCTSVKTLRNPSLRTSTISSWDERYLWQMV